MYLEYQNDVTGFSIKPWSNMFLNISVGPSLPILLADIPISPEFESAKNPLKWVASAKVWSVIQIPEIYKICKNTYPN